MYAPYSRRARRRSPSPIRPAPLALTLVAPLAGAAVVGLLVTRLGRPEPGLPTDVPAAGALAALAAAAVTVLLLHRAVRHEGRPYGRTIGWFAAPTAAVAVTGFALLAGAGAGVSTVDLSAWVAAGLVASVVAAVPPLLLASCPAANALTRVRLGLDAASAGIFLLFTCWVLVVAPRGDPDSAVFWVILVGCAGLSIAVVTALQARAARRAVAACAGGVAATLLGLGGLATAIEDAGTGWATVSGVVIIAGLAVLAAGCARLGATGQPPQDTAPDEPVQDTGRPEPSATREGRVTPAFALPAAAAIIVALHQVFSGRQIDRAAIVLGLLGIGLVSLGHVLAARDAEQTGRTGRAARQSRAAREAPAPAQPYGQVLVAEPAEPPPYGEGLIGDSDRTGATESDPAPSPPPVAQPPASAEPGSGRYARVWATVDPVTGLASRRELWLSISASRFATRDRGALLAIGLGEATLAEELLLAAVDRLRRIVGEHDLIARLGTGEVAVLTRDNLVRAYGLASHVVQALAAPIDLPDGGSASLSVAVGITDLPGASGADDVLRRADLALHRARQLGAGRIEWYDAVVEGAMQRRAVLLHELPGALRRRELDLIYQPIMDLVRGRPLAVEALLRWRHPRLGTLLPADVIPVAEELGVMDEVGQWVLRRAAGQLASWLREGRNLSMTINVSPRELDTTEFAGEVRGVLADHSLAADRLVLEVAETGLDDGAALPDRVGALHALGVRTALDEFGTGSASLGFLRRLPIDMVKIGRSFFDDVDGITTSNGTPLIDVMVGVGQRLGIDVVAHGVEAPAQLDVVRGAGCRLGQGHLFAYPQPAERTEAYLDGFPRTPWSR